MKKLLLLTLFALLCSNTWAQMSQLHADIKKITEGKKLTIGVAVYDFSNEEIIAININEKFPMQSVFKLHLAMAVLDQVDKGSLKLTDSIHFDKEELYSHLWSPIQKAYPDGDVKLPLSEVIIYTVQQSDNSGCDKLIQLLGGVKNVTKYIHSIGVKSINIENNELELQALWERQFRNWTTPMAAIELLGKINKGSLFKDETQQFLWQTMLGTSTGSIRKYLPKEVQVAYKTGFSGRNDAGVTAANNNVGIMMMPDGRRIAYAIFIADSTEEQDVNYDVIAEIGSSIFKNLKQCK